MSSVLVVEDDPLLAGLVEEAIAERGHDVVTAVRLAQAYAELEPEARTFAALVTDLDVAGGDGFDVARRARALNPAIEVAYMTGNPAHLARAPVRGALIFFKPFSVLEMADQICRRLQGDCARRPPG